MKAHVVNNDFLKLFLTTVFLGVIIASTASFAQDLTDEVTLSASSKNLKGKDAKDNKKIIEKTESKRQIEFKGQILTPIYAELIQYGNQMVLIKEPRFSINNSTEALVRGESNFFFRFEDFYGATFCKALGYRNGTIRSLYTAIPRDQLLVKMDIDGSVYYLGPAERSNAIQSVICQK